MQAEKWNYLKIFSSLYSTTYKIFFVMWNTESPLEMEGLDEWCTAFYAGKCLFIL
jgi:hypothetical protein